MQTLLLIFIAAAALVTLYILVRGVITMAQGKDVTGEQSQALMRARVKWQFIAIALVALFLIIARSGS